MAGSLCGTGLSDNSQKSRTPPSVPVLEPWACWCGSAGRVPAGAAASALCAVLFGAAGATGLTFDGLVGARLAKAVFLAGQVPFCLSLAIAFLSFGWCERNALWLFALGWLTGFRGVELCVGLRRLGRGGTFAGLFRLGVRVGLWAIVRVHRHFEIEVVIEGVPSHPLVRGFTGRRYPGCIWCRHTPPTAGRC